MYGTELLSGFVRDLWHLPLLFKLFLLNGVGTAGRRWWKRRQQAEMLAASENWPVYRARVVSAQILDRKSEGKHGSYFWPGLLTYSYTVPGQELEVGEYRKKFEDEDEADVWARGMRDTFVDVRVDPADAKRSVWQESPLLPGSQLRPPVLDASRTFEQSWGGPEIPLRLMLCAASVGALAAAWIQVSCWLGKPAITAEGNQTIFFGMHLGAIGVSIASSLLTANRRSVLSRGRWRDTFPKHSPEARVMQMLGAGFGLVFVYGWVRLASHPDAAAKWGVLMFSAVWCLFYTGSAMTCWRALRSGH